MFPCDKCGLCCQNLNGVKIYDDLNDGSGTCIHFDKKTKLCKIYHNRPEKCNVESMYKYFSRHMSYDEYIKLNMDSCVRLKEQRTEVNCNG